MKSKINYKNISFNFKRKNVLVVGGSRGIGLGVVRAFEMRELKFYISRNKIVDSSLKKVVHIPIDLSQKIQAKDVFNIIDDYGGIDILINSAAINYTNNFEKISSEEWDDVFKINLKSIFLLSQCALKTMKEKILEKLSIYHLLQVGTEVMLVALITYLVRLG